jgi:hypothetical protein
VSPFWIRHGIEFLSRLSALAISFQPIAHEPDSNRRLLRSKNPTESDTRICFWERPWLKADG